MSLDPYKILGVDSKASFEELKARYRGLVKKHHPDAGGDKKKILLLNAAWEVLGDKEHRLAYDRKHDSPESLSKEAQEREMRNARATSAAQKVQGQSAAAEEALVRWLEEVYTPIDHLLGQVITPFSAKLQDLSADPYDDALMEAYCVYLSKSQKKLEKVEKIYQSLQTPKSIQGFGLSLYHCLSQVQDAFNEIERYTMGYVDNYLHDGNEMLLEAKQMRSHLKKERLRLKIAKR